MFAGPYLGRPKKHLSMKYLLTLMMAILMVANANAQEKKGQTTEMKSRAEMLTESMTKELGLNSDQAVKVKAINQEYAEKAMGRASAKATEEVAPDAGALSDMNKALKKVLTPEQYEQWIKAQTRGNGTSPDGLKINEVDPVE